MNKDKLRIVFMGTPEFAVASLRAMVENAFNVVGVITATDKYGGRGGKTLIESAVKKYALSVNIPVLQPSNLKKESFLDELRALKADVQIVVAFRMLPVVVWDMPKHGTINLHGSLLPKFRGAAPINWAIIRGEEITGVSTFKLKHEIDTGDIIFQEKMSIGKEDTAGDVHDKMMILGAEVILKTLVAITENNIHFQPQPIALISDAPKINRETCHINFHNTATNIYNLIRGLSPYPTAWFPLEELEIKVFRAKKEMSVHQLKAGTILSDQKSYLKIACLDGYIWLEEIKASGKKKMDIRSFLNGYKF
jgi:methionyl-tRNA formyltransferase